MANTLSTEYDEYDFEPDPPEPEEPKKKKWWLTPLGLLFLLALCDSDDDDRERQYCYSFGAEKLCFSDPLPANKHCYLESDSRVRCYDEPK